MAFALSRSRVRGPLALAWPAIGRLDARPLRWGVGAYLSLLGTLMVVAPHQFAAPSYAGFHPGLAAWGALYFAARLLLVGAAALAPRPWLAAVAHLAAGTALLLFAFGVAAVGAWLGAASYAVLGVGTIVSAAGGRRADRAEAEPPAGDLLTFLLAVACF